MKQEIIVNGILENNGKILLAKRAMTKKIAPGKYHLAGGHVEFGEWPEQALIREFMEEFKLAVKPTQIIRTFSYINDDTHTIGITYTLTAKHMQEPLFFEPQDNESIVWATKDDLHRYLKADDQDFITLSLYFNSVAATPA